MIKPCLWFDGNAEDAAEFYVSVFPNSRIDARSTSGIDWPGGKAGDCILVDFTFDGLNYQAMNGGPGPAFSDAMSQSVSCADQAEMDRLWNALQTDGGEPVMCGWLKDRFGVRWRIVPREFEAMIRDNDPERSKRAMTAMSEMVKLDVAKLKEAYEG